MSPPNVAGRANPGGSDTDNVFRIEKKGRVVGRVELCGFALTDTVLPAGCPIEVQSSHPTLVFILSGELEDRENGEASEPCSPGHLLVQPAGTPSHHVARDSCHCMILEIGPQRLDAIRELTDVLERKETYAGSTISNLALRLYNETRDTDDCTPLALEGLALEWIAALARHREPKESTKEPPWLHIARDYIHEHFDKPLRLGEIARQVDVHPTHLTRVFRRYFQCTIGEYLRMLRLDYVAKKLVECDASLAEIALGAGFCDQSHLANTFKRFTGMTPARYRSAVRAGECDPRAFSLNVSS